MENRKVVNKNTVFAALGGFQYGLNSTVIAGALLFITVHFNLNHWQEGMVASSFLFGALCTACFAGFLANKMGRRGAMILAASLFFTGILMSVFAPSFHFLLAGRVVLGLGGGIMMTVVPLYLTEIAPAQSRGAVVNLNQIGISSGALIAYAIGFGFSLISSWKWMLAMGLIPAALQLIGLFKIPETHSAASSQELANTSWKSLWLPKYRSRVLMGVVLTMMQQVTGMNAIFYYAPYILEDAGFSSESALFFSIGIGVVYLLSILISFWLVDRAGRRPLVFFSLCGMVLDLFAIATFLHHGNLTLALLLAIIFFYAIGVGPLPQTIISEICPLEIRGHALTLAGFVGWICNFLVTLTFLDLSEWLTPSGTFYLYGLLGLLGLVYLLRRIPETKQKTLEEIEKELANR